MNNSTLRVQALIASQRLQKVGDQVQPATRRDEPGEAGQTGPERTRPRSAANQALAAHADGDYDRRWVATLANKLLTTGTTQPDQEAIIELRLGDLPADLQQRIQALVQAKLSLGLESEAQPATPKAKGRKPGPAARRGRKARTAQKR